LFVGQRREGFVVNLGETFDLINTNPLGPVDGEENTLADKNITTLALEIPATCLTNGSSALAAGSCAEVSQCARREQDQRRWLRQKRRLRHGDVPKLAHPTIGARSSGFRPCSRDLL
jgi:hypothetical protein